jgi:hypothetical protein
MLKVLTFESTYAAYDAIQVASADEIAMGDVILIPSERVVGVADTWPVAVTLAYGSLHVVMPGKWESIVSCFPAGTVSAAISLALSLGFPVPTEAEKWGND